MENEITQVRLKELLHFCPETGVFTWKSPTSRRVKTGEIAGSPNSHKYIQIELDSARYMAHRLVFLHETGNWPDMHVDHINGNRSDNRWCNLRAATISENQRNRKFQSNNKSGFKGVSWHKKSQKWWAKLGVNKQTVSLGLYFSELEAYTAYCVAAHRYFGEFANIG